MGYRFLQRRATAAEWEAANPVLGDGELGVEKDTRILKIGDGVTSWTELEPAFEEPPVVSVFGRTGEVVATSDDLSDRTTVGEAIFTAVDEETARTAIGAGTGNGNVTGDGVVTIKAISQAAYDALAVKDGATLYAIPES